MTVNQQPNLNTNVWYFNHHETISWIFNYNNFDVWINFKLAQFECLKPEIKNILIWTTIQQLGVNMDILEFKSA